MIFLIFSLIISAIIAIFVPWLIPITYWISTTLIKQNVNRLIIAGIWTWASVVGNIILWHLDTYIEKWILDINNFIHKKIFTTKTKLPNNKPESKSSLFKNIKEWSTKNLKKATNQYTLFVLAIFCTRSIIPDIITVRIVRKKQHILLFIIACCIWKSLVYIPVIYAIAKAFGKI